MLNPNFKWNAKNLKKVGISATVLATAITGYTAVQASIPLQAETDTTAIAQLQTPEPTVPFGRGDREGDWEGRGGRGGHGHDHDHDDDEGREYWDDDDDDWEDGEGRGGHHHDQTLSEDAFDPTNLVTIVPTTEVTPTVEPTLAPTTAASAEVTEEAAAASAVATEEATAEATEAVVEPIVTAEATEEVVNAGTYVNGQYVGSSIRADRWGNMQVVVVVEEGEVSNVLIADYPRNTTLSDTISRNAMPTLIQEAVTAQSAEIDIVSGATDTSVAFIQSLQTALDEALIVDSVSNASNS